MPQRLSNIAIPTGIWIGIVILGFMLRLHSLDERPIHADEATGARIASNLLANDSYAFDPTHFHGPWLSQTTLPLATMRQESTWQELSITTLRLSPLIAGTLLILTPLLWLRILGQAATLTSAAFIATSPLLIYYSRMYIHESWLALFAMLACGSLFHLAQKPKLILAIGTGILIGLMYATKETFAISILSWAPALAIYFWMRKHQQNAIPPKSYLQAALLTLGFALLTASYFYSQGFRNMDGMVDAIRTYFVYQTTPGHHKPFSYYLHLLLWPKQQIGIWWTEASIALFALFTLTLAILKKQKALIFLAIATLLHLFIYSLISYKTPWLMLVPWAHACLLAGAIFTLAHHPHKATRIVLFLLVLTALSYQSYQSLAANQRFANDPRNPYAYVPTSNDLPRLQHWLDDLAAQQPSGHLGTLAVIGTSYWPLPWYLRDHSPIGYWPQSSANMIDYPLLFVMPDQVANTRELLQHSHTQLPRSLRPNKVITLFLRNDLWQQWIDTP